MQANMKVRRAAKAAGVPFWKVAKQMGVSEPTITRKLREELPAEERKRFLKIIKELERQEAKDGADTSKTP